MAVGTNKGDWYKLLIQKVDNAIDSKNYFEAIFIEYMLVDDRIKSICKMAGIALSTEKKGRVKPKMLGTLNNELKTKRNTLTGGRWELLDITIELADIEWKKSMTEANYPREDVMKCIRAPRYLVNYQISPDGKIESKYLECANIMDMITVWSHERNHWMHQAGDDNLTIEEYEEIITPLAIDGAAICRHLCDTATKISRSLEK